MTNDVLVITAHPDDAEAQMGGTLAKLAAKGQRILKRSGRNNRCPRPS